MDSAEIESKHLKLNEKKWDRWAESLDNENWRTRFLRDGQRKVIAVVDLKEGANFLDIGCGTGWAVHLAAESVSNNGTFYGVDLSSKMVEKAKENFRGRENFHFVQADSGSIPLDSDFFDVVICTNSFHHYLHPEKVMAEINRLLKSGGKVYILDPTADTWFGKIFDWMGRITEHAHVKMYSTEEFRNMFTDSGFKYIRTEVVRSLEKIHIAEKRARV